MLAPCTSNVQRHPAANSSGSGLPIAYTSRYSYQCVSDETVRGARIAIVGAGPAGLTAAITAAHFGLMTTVFDGAEDFTRVGGGIVIHSNGLRVLERLGLLESFKPLIFPCRKLVLELGGQYEIVSDYGELPIPHNYLAIVLRYQLQEHLLTSARKVAPILFAHRCTYAEARQAHARLEFANGARAEFEVVIGADGAHSQVRQSLGVSVVKKAAGAAYLRGVTELPSHPPVVREIWGSDGRRFGIAPLTEGRTYFYCSAPRGQWHEVLSQRLGAWIDTWNPYGELVRSALHRVPDWNAVNYDEPEDVRLKRWYSPPVFLIGDAAHAMTPNYGQGANAAMVDAVVLLTLLARSLQNGSSLAEVGREYESIRRQFVDQTQTAAWRLGVVAQWRSPLARSLRDRTIRFLSKLRPLSRTDLLLLAGHNPREEHYL
jgi:2-polyprenyl-6-methoxyphenol hydroxylase-like FAD-dependent oxidoreductase